MKLKRCPALDDTKRLVEVQWYFWCPGCNELHNYTTDRKEGLHPGWTFNGDMEKPTFSPSLLYPSKAVRCHLFLKDGKLEFCGDCGHALAGKTVDLPDYPDDMNPWDAIT